MAWQVRPESRRSGHGNVESVHILEDEPEGPRAEIWPGLGFNCTSWCVPHQGQLLELLWSDPQMVDNRQATRSGIPILFPFPNRIRDGRFTWAGKSFELPINDPQSKNAIHGFVCYRPWRVVDAKATESSARVKGVFESTRDAADCRSLWPAAYRLEATYTLSKSTLRLDVSVRNVDHAPLPFGFGLHPYFRFAPDRCRFLCDGPLERWVLQECLPTGDRMPLEGRHRLLVERDHAGATDHWDDAYRLLAAASVHAQVMNPSQSIELDMECGPGFGDLVVFTPPHREAICLEPYTCVTDAINLQQRGLDAGLIVLRPEEEWQSWVRFTLR